MSTACQVWQVTHGSLVENDTELQVRYIERFDRLADARAFLTSDAFMRTYIRDPQLTVGQFFLIPEAQLFIVLPGRIHPSFSIADLTTGADAPADPAANPEGTDAPASPPA